MTGPCSIIGGLFIVCLLCASPCVNAIDALPECRNASFPRCEEAYVAGLADSSIKRYGIRLPSFQRGRPEFDSEHRTWTVTYVGTGSGAEHRYFVVIEETTGRIRVLSRP